MHTYYHTLHTMYLHTSMCTVYFSYRLYFLHAFLPCFRVSFAHLLCKGLVHVLCILSPVFLYPLSFSSSATLQAARTRRHWRSRSRLTALLSPPHCVRHCRLSCTGWYANMGLLSVCDIGARGCVLCARCDAGKLLFHQLGSEEAHIHQRGNSSQL